MIRITKRMGGSFYVAEKREAERGGKAPGRNFYPSAAYSRLFDTGFVYGRNRFDFLYKGVRRTDPKL